MEAIKDMRLLLLVDARSLISHPDDYLALMAFDTDCDRRLRRTVFEGITEQVIQNLLNAGLVPGAGDTLFVAFQLDTPPADRLLLLDDAPDQFNNVDVFLVIELEQFAAYAGQVAHLINEAIHAPGLLNNALQGLYLLFNRQGGLRPTLRCAALRWKLALFKPAQQPFCLALHGGKGGAQFVAGKRKKIVLDLVQSFGFFAGLHLFGDLSGRDEHKMNSAGLFCTHDRCEHPVPDAFPTPF